MGVSRIQSCATRKDTKSNQRNPALEEPSGARGREREEGWFRSAPGIQGRVGLEVGGKVFTFSR